MNDDKVLHGDIPTNRDYYEKLNERLRAVGLPELIISGNAVYKDALHEYLGIGIKLEG